MARLTVSFFADALQKQSQMIVLLPREAEADEPLPVFYLLHGLSDDHTIWTRRTSIERYVEGLPLIVVMPDGGRGFYTDAVEGPAGESHVMGDVIDFVERVFPARTDRAGRCIGGLSMGGYGAMKLALKHPDRFCSVTSHSGAFDVRRLVEDHDASAEFIRIFGREPGGGEEDPYALAARAERDLLPAIRIDCGTEDFLIEENRAFHAHLERLGVAHEYEEFAGSHQWGYWDAHVQEALRFHAAALGIRRAE